MKRFLLIVSCLLLMFSLYAADIVAYGYGATPEEATINSKNELAASIKVDIYNSVYIKNDAGNNSLEEVYSEEGFIYTDLSLFGVVCDAAIKISDNRYKVVSYISEDSVGFYENELIALNKRLSEWKYIESNNVRNDFENIKSILDSYQKYNVYKYVFYVLKGKAWTDIYPITINISDIEFKYNLLISSYMKEILKDLADIEANKIFAENSNAVEDIKHQLEALKVEQDNNLRMRNLRLENFKTKLDEKNKEYVEKLQIVERNERAHAESITVDSVYKVLEQFNKRIDDIKDLKQQQINDVNQYYQVLRNNIYYNNYTADYLPFETIGFKGVPQDKAVKDRINGVTLQIEALDKAYELKKSEIENNASVAIKKQITDYGAVLRENNGKIYTDNNIGGNVITRIEGFDMDSLTWYGNAYIDVLGVSLVVPFEFSYSDWIQDNKKFNEMDIQELTEIFLAIPFSYEVEISYKFEVDFLQRIYGINIFSIAIKEPVSGMVIKQQKLNKSIKRASFISDFKVSDAHLFRIRTYLQGDYAFCRAGANLSYINELDIALFVGCRFEWIPYSCFSYALNTGIGMSFNNLGNIVENTFIELGCDLNYMFNNFYIGVGGCCDIGVFVDSMLFDKIAVYAVPSLYINGGFANEDFSIGLFYKIGYELSDRVMQVNPAYRSSVGMNISYTVYNNNEK